MLSTTIQCAELRLKLNHTTTPSLKVLFTTLANGPISKPDPSNREADRFIPNSLCFDFETDFVDSNAKFSSMMPTRDAFQMSARKLGLNLDDEIVVYDDFGNFCASRAWFMLISMGFSRVKVLDGGLPEWLKNNYETQASLSNPDSGSQAIVQASSQFSFVNSEYIQRKISSGNSQEQDIPVQIIDARSYGRFAGLEPEPRENMRSGHIPSSKNIHYASLQTEGLFRSDRELCNIFNKKGINLGNEMIISCGSGITACIVAQAAITLGARNIKVYDASWSEWGASKTLPVEALT